MTCILYLRCWKSCFQSIQQLNHCSYWRSFANSVSFLLFSRLLEVTVVVRNHTTSTPPHLAMCLADQSSPPFLPSFLQRTRASLYPARGFYCSSAGPVAQRCPVINESFHTHGLSWPLGWEGGTFGTAKLLMKVCRVTAAWDGDCEGEMKGQSKGHFSDGRRKAMYWQE